MFFQELLVFWSLTAVELLIFQKCVYRLSLLSQNADGHVIFCGSAGENTKCCYLVCPVFTVRFWNWCEHMKLSLICFVPDLQLFPDWLLQIRQLCASYWWAVITWWWVLHTVLSIGVCVCIHVRSKLELVWVAVLVPLIRIAKIKIHILLSI